MSTNFDVNAAGKTVSKSNADKQKKAWKRMRESLATLTNLMIETGVITQEEADEDIAVSASSLGMDGLGGNAATDLAGSSPSANVSTPDRQAQAEILAQAYYEEYVAQIERATWNAKLNYALKVFLKRFKQIHNDSDQQLLEDYDIKDRQEGYESLMTDMMSMMKSIHESFPGRPPTENCRWIAEDSYMYLKSQAATSGTEDGAVEIEGASSQEPVPVNQVEVSFSASTKDWKPVDLSAGLTDDSKAVGVFGNKHHISGSIFRIDEISGGVPAKGYEELPLYIPEYAAERAISQASGLPLDASADLMNHEPGNPIGVIQSARIEGNDFIIDAVLWPTSKPENVLSVLRNRDQMGFSLMAKSLGHREKVDGKDVFWVDELMLTGACMLFAEVAAYPKTRLISASRVTPPDLPASLAAGTNVYDLAASAAVATVSGGRSNQQLDQGEQETMNTQELRNELNAAMQPFQGVPDALQTLAGAVQNQGEAIQQQQAQIAAQQQTIDLLQQDLTQRQESAAAQEAELAAKRSEETMKQTMVDVIRETLGFPQPHRRTGALPISASGMHLGAPTGNLNNSPVDPNQPTELSAAERRLAEIDGALKTLQASGSATAGNQSEYIRLIDERSVIVRNMAAQGQPIPADLAVA